LAESSFEHLLVTLDGSRESREILPFAREVAGAFEARMTLLRVVSPHFSLASSFISHTAHEDRGMAEERDAALAALEAEARELRTDGFRVEVETVTAPHPQEGILAFATDEKVDLIAMATHGRGGVTRLFLGSVADKVIRGGTIPVLLHRAS
jgi:nucleotide-binding universal stress UspA family protein